MPDISKCSNVNCVMKDKCYRYVCIPDKVAQSYSFFLPISNKIESFKCEFFYGIKINKNQINPNV